MINDTDTPPDEALTRDYAALFSEAMENMVDEAHADLAEDPAIRDYAHAEVIIRGALLKVFQSVDLLEASPTGDLGTDLHLLHNPSHPVGCGCGFEEGE